MLMKTTRLIIDGALQTTPKELAPYYRGFTLQFLGNNNALFAFHQASSWEKICLTTTWVMTRCTSPLPNMGHLQAFPGTGPHQSQHRGEDSTAVKYIISALYLASQVLFSSFNHRVISTVKYSFSLLLLCHGNTIEGSAGKTNDLEKIAQPEEEVSSAQTQLAFLDLQGFLWYLIKTAVLTIKRNICCLVSVWPALAAFIFPF